MVKWRLRLSALTTAEIKLCKSKVFYIIYLCFLSAKAMEHPSHNSTSWNKQKTVEITHEIREGILQFGSQTFYMYLLLVSSRKGDDHSVPTMGGNMNT